MKFYIYTLGCKVNSYESRIMTEDLINAGYVEEKDNNIPADIYIINTCSVTNTADSKSLKLIRQAIKKNKDAIIVVCGCLAQVKPETVNIEGVDIVIGNKNKSKVSEYINEYVKNKNKKTDIYDISNVEFETMQLNNFDKTRAFIKIQDGCNNFCAYCIIPYTRGSVRSKPREDILNEIDHLTLNGHKEIVLTGIHTGNYGSEFDNYDFADLLNEIVKIKKLSRIRISSIEITELNDRVLEIIKNNNVLVDHLHIPLQSGSDEILKLMNRKYDTKYFIEKINNYLDNNNYYEALIELLFYGVLENKQPIFDEVIININEYELKEYLKINLYEGISYINSLKILAQKDNMYANAQLGSLEYSGLISGKIDYEKCYEYYMKAALKGHSKAAWMIGNLIFSNKVKEKNVDIMLKFLNKAVDLGSIAALNTLGRYYLNIDDVTALKYFKKAAEYGYAYAYNNLGMYYEKNNDLKLAKNYYKLSADLLNSWALNKMGEICINESNYKDALFYFNKAINCPISERSYYAYYNLAKIYKNGNKKLNISKNEKLYNKYINIFQNKKES